MTKLFMVGFGPVITLTKFALWGLSGAFKAIQMLMFAFNLVLRMSSGAVLLFNAALWANPITWIVVAVVALIAGLGALIYYWKDVKKAALDFIHSLVGPFNKFRAFLETLTPFKLWKAEIRWILDMVNKIPGIHIGKDTKVTDAAAAAADAGFTQPGAAGSTLDRPSIVPSGGLQQSITNNKSGTVVEKMEIHTNQKVNGFMLADELAMA